MTIPIKILRWLFFEVIVRPFLLIILGLNVRRRELLPTDGPAMLVANHNSHLDVLVLMSLFPLSKLPKIRPIAARDYFLKNKRLAWFSLNIIGIIPIDRYPKSKRDDPLAPIGEAVERGEIVIIFPEGGRGEPEHLSDFKSGVAHLAKRYPDLPFYPIFIHGLGKILPKGEALVVPFFCDVFVGESMKWCGEKAKFMEQLTIQMQTLAAEGHFPVWE